MSDENPYTTPLPDPVNRATTTVSAGANALQTSMLVLGVGASALLAGLVCWFCISAAAADTGYPALLLAFIVSPVANIVIALGCVAVCAIGSSRDGMMAAPAAFVAPFLSTVYVFYYVMFVIDVHGS
ncbi:hypothetical protein LOC71_04860 [Rhodopirellula sp. JC740]|uniref:Transmembrane protein n=1 Tax=Rhodopirellula halodulae TaxID=2894198 RepID=A0ABS8NDI2_9BACT|nr:hypothetical protein [Rhodopirellula sp. JC740]MCC9641594.1 hypothetical protein [Rhodopirellula sp. JC740]